jgi:hypothetical protein
MAKKTDTIIQNNKDKNLLTIVAIQTDVEIASDGDVIKKVAKRKLR